MLKKNEVIRFTGFYFLGIVFSLFTRSAPTPENSVSFFYAIPAFFIFLLFMAGMFSWGSIFRRCLKQPSFGAIENALFDLTLGTVFFYLLAYVLTVTGLFTSSMNIALWLIPSAGFMFGRVPLPQKKWSVGFLGFVIFIKLLEGLQFHLHGDAYVTYLPAPRLWAETGNFKGFLQYSQYFLTTSWESLAAWGTALMGLKGGAGLDITQWFSQWITGGIAVLGIFLVSIALCARLAVSFPLNPMILALASFSAAITALQIPILRWTANLAKNDLGAAFWGASAFYLSTYLLPSSMVLAFVIGIITGTAVIAKLTAGILGVCIGVALLVRSPKSFFWFAVGGLVAISPIVIRNWWMTGSPTFPWFPSLFPTPYLSDSVLQGTMNATNKGLQFANLKVYLQEILEQIPLLISVLMILSMKKFSQRAWKTILVPFVAMIGFTVVFRPSTEVRYQGPTLILFSVYATFFTFYFLQMIQERWPNRFTSKLCMLAMLVILATSNISFFSLFQIGGPKFGSWSKKSMLMDDVGGPGKLWIRSHLKPNDSILVVGDGYPYYLMDYRIQEYGQLAGYEKIIAEKRVDEAAALFKSTPFHYLYLSSVADFEDYRPTLAHLIEWTKSWKQDCKLFEYPFTPKVTSQLWDLNCLK